MSKKNFKEIAQKTLAKYPTSDKCWVTTDGQSFVSENYANLHAGSNANGKKLGVLKFDRAGLLENIDVNAAEKVATTKDDRAKAEAKVKAAEKAKAEAEAKAKAEAEAKAKAEAEAKAKAEAEAEAAKAPAKKQTTKKAK